MFVYRIANAQFKELTLTGIGAEKFGGRWNEKGTRAVYCSENISLALLEYYVHASNHTYLPKSILVAKIFIPDSFPIIRLEELPENWNHYPYHAETASIFTELAKSNQFFGIEVPSSIVGLENNFVLNPLYVDFGKVSIDSFIELLIDLRLRNN